MCLFPKAAATGCSENGAGIPVKRAHSEKRRGQNGGQNLHQRMKKKRGSGVEVSEKKKGVAICKG